MDNKRFFAGTLYSVAVGNKATGEVIQLPSVETVILTTKPREQFEPIHIPQLDGIEFSVQFEGSFADYVERAFKPPTFDGVLHLLPDGKVIAYVSFNVNGAVYSPRWYFVDVIDRGVWRYALRNGLQLEDAVRELNWVYRDQGAVRFEVAVNAS